MDVSVHDALSARTKARRKTPISAFFGMFSRDLGIDLDCATTLVYVRGKGIVISEPSVVAIDTRTRRTFGVGAEAKAIVGKTPESIVAVRPLKDGVIADFDAVEMMLHYFTSSALRPLDSYGWRTTLSHHSSDRLVG